MILFHKFISSASYAAGSITLTLKSLTSISVSFLHFGQDKGNFLNSVYFSNLIRVLFLQTGDSNHCVSLNILSSYFVYNIFLQQFSARHDYYNYAYNYV